MTLTFETTHEYYMKDPSIFYCSEHDGLCISADFEDTVRFTGISEQSIKKFVHGLFKHNPELAASLQEELGMVKKTSSTTAKSRKTKSLIEAVK
tara:strand:+ start:4027 stop:4308 length:282 start_codon:yes stop_codon:yes gene_type:complete